ncbi:hypothetical protein [Bacillus sp. FJAT-27225]|uniref:hypothetical protein n=1 Tax=Bacillus sp. FJAT-27225 TaxID=1743144 RepID=UPI0020C756BE|nr:hypothetical protein [Bacillus sp. FJAT-27225]
MSKSVQKTPVKNRIGSVFIPVRDLERQKNGTLEYLGWKEDKNISAIFLWHPWKEQPD